MSLDFDVTNMKNFNVLTTILEKDINTGEEVGRKWHPVTNALIFATMAIGMSSITEDNWEEFYQRLNMWERCVGCSLWRADHQRDNKNFITPLEVYMHIGLHTNASRKTLAQFTKDCFEAVKDGNYLRPNKVAEEYAELGLDTITEEEYQAAQFVKERKDLDTIGVMLKRYKETGSTSTNPLVTDENITSVS